MDAEPWLPPVLIDENLGATIVEFFRSRGYVVFKVGEVLPRGSPDVSVTAAALDQGAIVVTMDTDFKYWREAAAAEHQRKRLESADRILFRKCRYVQAPLRVAQLIDIIESEYRLAKAANRKFMIHITEHSFTVFR